MSGFMPVQAQLSSLSLHHTMILSQRLSQILLNVDISTERAMASREILPLLQSDFSEVRLAARVWSVAGPDISRIAEEYSRRRG